MNALAAETKTRAATQRIARLEAPDEELATVRDEAVEGLSRILVTVRSPEPVTDEAFERAIAGWAKRPDITTQWRAHRVLLGHIGPITNARAT